MDPDQLPLIPEPLRPVPFPAPPAPVPEPAPYFGPAAPPPAGRSRPGPAGHGGPGGRSRRPFLAAGIAGGVALLALCVAGGVVAFAVRDRIFGSQGSTTITVEAVEYGNSVPNPKLLAQTRQALMGRAEAAGLADPSVTLSGERRIVVRVAGDDQAEQLRALVAVGALKFRQVLATATIQPDPAPDGTPPASVLGPLPTREQVIAKLGRAYEIAQPFAQSLRPPEQIDTATRQALAPFETLAPVELAALPAEVQYAVPTVSCRQLLARPIEAVATSDERLATCDRLTPSSKYLLDVAPVSGADIRDATATRSDDGRWVVGISFNEAGQQRWTELSRAASSSSSRTNQVAIVVDDGVLSAPAVQGVLTGDAQISGNFSQVEAEGLAARLDSGALPIGLHIIDLTTDPR